MKALILKSPSNEIRHVYFCQPFDCYLVKNQWQDLLTKICQSLNFKLLKDVPLCSVYYSDLEKNDNGEYFETDTISLGLLPWAQAFVIFTEIAKKYNHGILISLKSEKISPGNQAKIYRLMNHDNIENGQKAKFECYAISEYNEIYGTHYKSIDEALIDDPEYIFTETDVIEWENS